MKTVNSLSGGKTSSYIAANYPADYNVFALVRTNDKKCLFPDKKLRQIVSEKLGMDFIGTLEEDMIIYTMLDLEQYIGQEIHWVSGKTFDEVITRNGKKYLPNVTQRFCTTLMKLEPLFKWWQNEINEVVEMRIGFRANEGNRANTMLSKVNENGNSTYKTIIGKRGGKTNQNKWADIEWQRPSFPLIDDNIYKDKIENYWSDKSVRFAYMNNCIGCFHRNAPLLKLMSDKHPNKFNWFVNAEANTGHNIRTFKNGITYKQIKNSFTQIKLDFDDFTDCDSGYCGL